MSASMSRESSEEDAPSKSGEYKLENFDLIKTIGTGMQYTNYKDLFV